MQESTEPSRPDQIAERIVDAIMARKLAPGARLGEQQLADLFEVSRTIVREAMSRLAARGMVEVNPRRGWFVVRPSLQATRDALATRRAIETGALQMLHMPLDTEALGRLKRHVEQERAAIADPDANGRSFPLSNFHVCLAECTGNRMLADILRDLTARTRLSAALYRSTHKPNESCAEHAGIVEALEAGDTALAARRMGEHIDNVARHLGQEPVSDDPLSRLRNALVDPYPPQ